VGPRSCWMKYKEREQCTSKGVSEIAEVAWWTKKKVFGLKKRGVAPPPKVMWGETGTQWVRIWETNRKSVISLVG